MVEWPAANNCSREEDERRASVWWAQGDCSRMKRGNVLEMRINAYVVNRRLHISRVCGQHHTAVENHTSDQTK